MATVSIGSALTDREGELQALARATYMERLAAGVAREQARKDLPLSTYTEAYWKINLHNLLHFLRLRMDSHAQHEIREYATVIGEQIVMKWCPTVWEAFLDYGVNAISFSKTELQLLAAVSAGDAVGAAKIASSAGWLERTQGKLRGNRERVEFEGKLRAMGLAVPWS